MSSFLFRWSCNSDQSVVQQLLSMTFVARQRLRITIKRPLIHPEALLNRIVGSLTVTESIESILLGQRMLALFDELELVFPNRS